LQDDYVHPIAESFCFSLTKFYPHW